MRWTRKTSDRFSIFMLVWCTVWFLFDLVSEEGWFRIFMSCVWVTLFILNAWTLRISRETQRLDREHEEAMQKIRGAWPLN